LLGKITILKKKGEKVMEKECKFKVGDEVFIEGNSSKRITRIEKITKAGNLVAEGKIFYPDGSQRGGNIWHSYSLPLITPEKKEVFLKSIEKHKVIEKIKQTNWNFYSLELLKKIDKLLELVDGKEKENG
jgi:hypothetical protein